jgi:hypothetical protein
MENTKITFEKLQDGTCVITVRGKNMHNDTFIRQEIIKESAVFEALQKACEGNQQPDTESKCNKHGVTNTEERGAVCRCKNPKRYIYGVRECEKCGKPLPKVN